jgi:hypothetical protein
MKMTAGIVVALFLCLHFDPASAVPEAYTMADLQALADRRGWVELIEHLEDVRPKARTPHWTTLLGSAARGCLGESTLLQRPLWALRFLANMMSRYPQLQHDSAFMAKRAQVVLRAAKRCFDDPYTTEECADQLDVLVRQTPQARGLAFECGKLVRRNRPPHEAVRYFHVALMGDISKDTRKRCKDADVAFTVMLALGLPAKHASASLARDIAFGPCYPQLAKELARSVISDSNRMDNTCRGLLAKEALEGLRRTKCSRLVARKKQ